MNRVHPNIQRPSPKVASVSNIQSQKTEPIESPSNTSSSSSEALLPTLIETNASRQDRKPNAGNWQNEPILTQS